MKWGRGRVGCSFFVSVLWDILWTSEGSSQGWAAKTSSNQGLIGEREKKVPRTNLQKFVSLMSTEVSTPVGAYFEESPLRKKRPNAADFMEHSWKVKRISRSFFHPKEASPPDWTDSRRRTVWRQAWDRKFGWFSTLLLQPLCDTNCLLSPQDNAEQFLP